MTYPSRPVRPLPSAPAGNTDEGVRTGLVTRIIIVGTIVLGQLWALTVALEAYLLGETAQAWGLAGFSAISFAVVALLLRLDPAARADRDRPGRR